MDSDVSAAAGHPTSAVQRPAVLLRGRGPVVCRLSARLLYQADCRPRLTARQVRRPIGVASCGVYWGTTSTNLIFMAALRSRCGHYVFAVWFLSSSIFFPRLISAVADWMSTILAHMV